jgi:malonyl CoA-acyl carrier protein transacylase
MFEGTEEDLKQTKVTQPAIFLHSVLLAKHWIISSLKWWQVTLWVNFLPW